MMTETVVTVQEAPRNNEAAKPDGNQQAHRASSLAWIKINLEYFKTLPGLLKLLELIIGIFAMSFASPAILGGTHFFLFVATTAFLITIIWVFIYLLSVREALRTRINWLHTELLYTGIYAVLYFIGFIVQLIVSGRLYHYVLNILGGVFGLFNTLAYGLGTYLLYVEWKNSQTST